MEKNYLKVPDFIEGDCIHGKRAESVSQNANGILRIHTFIMIELTIT